MQAPDRDLLEAYVRDKSERAFRRIVERYGQLVYSAAYRRLRDHQLAEDAAQAAFIILAQKAHRLKMNTKLGGWLWRTALNCARNIAQSRLARARREERAAPVPVSDDGPAAWERIAPEFDEALAGLPAAFRTVLVAHFLEGKTQSEVADECGLKADAVQKRVSRGLAKLRRALRIRGVAVPAALLASLAGSRTAEAAPASLLEGLHGVAYGTITGATAPTHSAWLTAKGVLKMMALARTRKIGAYAAATLCVLGLTAAVAMKAGLIGGEYRMPDEPRFARVTYPKSVLEARAGYILDFYPDSWLKHDLSGTWRIRTFPRIDGVDRWDADRGQGPCYEANLSGEVWKDVPVPYSLGKHKAASPDRSKKFNGVAWYRHSFTLAADWPKRIAQNWRVLLRIEAIGAGDEAEVWLNAKPVGDRLHGWNAFEFDVTDKVEAVGPNSIAVKLAGDSRHYRKAERTGLWQPVRLVCVPPVRASQVLVAPQIDPPSLQVRIETANHGPAATRTLEAVVTPFNVEDQQERVVPLGSVEIPAGTDGKHTFRIKTPWAKLWTPHEPNLYLVAIRDSEGRELGRIRTGFRTMQAKDGDFYLNGNKIKLMGIQFGKVKALQAPGGWGCNRDNHVRKLIHGFKQANIHFGRPHAGEGGRGGMPATLYNICDEMGFMIYDEYEYSGAWLYETERLRQWGQEYTRWIKQVHNHPACVLWDFGGNERYTSDMEMVPVFNYLYAILDKHDLQRRPKTSSSGRLTYKRLERHPNLEKVDFADSHRYTGYGHGTYQDFVWIFKRQNEAAAKRYGKTIPTLNCEFGFPGDQSRYRANTSKIRDLYLTQPWGKKERKQWIEFATSERADVGGYLRSKGNWAGGRTWTTDPLRLWERKAIFSKRIWEVFRRAGDTIDGGHFNSQYYCLLVHGGGGHEGIHAAGRYLGLELPFETTKGEFFKTPQYYVWRRTFNPTFICLDIHDKNTFAGHLWKNTVHIMNDSHKDAGPAQVVVQVRSPHGRLLHQETVWQGRLAPYVRKTVPVQLTLGSAWPTGSYALELFLLDTRGRHLSDNSYPLHVAGRADLVRAIRPRGRVGLYETPPAGDKKEPAPTTASILRALRIPYKTIHEFSADPLGKPGTRAAGTVLDQLDVLVIGRNSLDMRLARNGPKITQWVRNGGRLLCFEQSKAGQLPFLPEVKVEPGKRATFSEILVQQHPIFAGLEQDHFDDWNGHGGPLFHNVLAPLNEGLLSVGPTAAHKGTDSMKMISASYRIGKGEVVLSQYDITRRYGRDSAATRLMQNILSYVMTQPQHALSLPFETTATAERRAHLPRKDAHFINLRESANWSLDEFESLPTGITTLTGDVPFTLIDPQKNRGHACIALKGSHHGQAPDKIGPVPVDRRLAALYLLQYATYAKNLPDGEPVFNVRLTYTDGREKVVPMRNRIETGDWWQAKDYGNASVVYRDGSKNLFLTEVRMPNGRAHIRSITFESTGKANPVILAATGALSR